MSKNIGIEAQYPIGFSEDVVRTLDVQFETSVEDKEFPQIDSNYKAYGLMAEKNVFVQTFAKGVSKAVSDALSAMPDSNEGFVQACDIAYGACVETAKAAIFMAMHMRNIIMQRSVYAGQEAGKTPLEAMADGEEGEVLDELDESEIEE